MEKDRGRPKEKWVTDVWRGSTTEYPLVKGVVVVINASLFPEEHSAP